MNRRVIVQYSIRFIGVILFILILLHTDFSNLGQVVSHVSPAGIILVVFLVVPIMVLKGMRWYVLTERLGLNLRSHEAIDGLCIAQMTSFTLPGALGDLVRIPFLKCRGNPSDGSILSVFIDAIVASVVPYIVAILAIAFFFGSNTAVLVNALLVASLLIIGGYATYKLIRVVIRPWWLGARIGRLKRGGVVGRFFLNLREAIHEIGVLPIAAAILLSGTAWFIYTLQGWVLAESLDISITWLEVALAVTLASMLAVVPISIQGIGVREGILLFVLSGMVGVNPSSVILFSVALTAVSLTPSIWGFISWVRDPFVKLEAESVEAAITEPNDDVVETSI
jgi:uncharacterized membrane protein YbhN (UPF0104 family)